MKGTSRRFRCAIYTRVSTEYGLEQEFNSLHAQREASEAYIKSQTHEGWSLVREAFDDGGFSGGSMERPALQRMLDEIRACRIDVVVVYKVDRLTRALSDFAKLVELFDAHNVSFVSVTQAFNTTTSMGRLTLNVLLSFAQFEREVTSERIRDKIAASKKRGLWVGGMIPLGYESRDKVLSIVEGEAETIRLIFRRYLDLTSLDKLMRDLREKGIVTKLRRLSNGRTIGGISFTRGPLAYLLRNRFYIGQIVYRGAVYPAAHPPILGRELFEAVQAKLSEQRVATTTRRTSSAALLMGRLFDDRGNRMGPTHAVKSGRRYRYYISVALVQGRQEDKGSIARVAAREIEARIVEALRSVVPGSDELDDRQLIATHLERAKVSMTEIVIHLACNDDQEVPNGAMSQRIVHVPFAAKRRVQRQILRCESLSASRPMRSRARATLLRAIAQGRAWIEEIAKGTSGIAAIASRESCSGRHVVRTVSLAFLAPDIVQAAIEGTLPRPIGVTNLFDLDSSWSTQRRALGFAKASIRHVPVS